MEGVPTKEFAEGESPVEGDNLGVLLKEKKLFHGSTNPSTEKFMATEEAQAADITDGTTVGSGIYLTSSENVAALYARRRLRNASKKDGLEATSYETSLDNLKFLDLRDDKNVAQFAEKFRPHLIDCLRNARTKSIDHSVANSIIVALGEIEKGVTLRSIHGLAGYAMAGVFTDFVKRQGYAGVVTMEGGEGHENDDSFYVGNHDTYVLFDPTKASIVGKKRL